jgi:hypothetical protein
LIGGILLILILAFVFFVTKYKQVGGQQVYPKRFVDEPLQIKAELRDLSGVTEKSSYNITGRSTVIGRAFGGIVIPKQTIGRQHAVIEYRDFAYWLIDEQSVNGTFLNGQRLEGKQKLKHGDHIRLDQYEFEFILPEMSDELSTVAIAKDLFNDQENTIAKHRLIHTPNQDARTGVRPVYSSGKEIDQFTDSTREAYRGPARPDQPPFPRGLTGRSNSKWVIWFASALGALFLVGIGLVIGIYIIGSTAPPENKMSPMARNIPEHGVSEPRPTEDLAQNDQSPQSMTLQANPAVLHVDNRQKAPVVPMVSTTPPNEPSTPGSLKNEGEKVMSKLEQPKAQQPTPSPKPSKPQLIPPPPSPPEKKVTPKPPVAKPIPPAPKPLGKKFHKKNHKRFRMFLNPSQSQRYLPRSGSLTAMPWELRNVMNAINSNIRSGKKRCTTSLIVKYIVSPKPKRYSKPSEPRV